MSPRLALTATVLAIALAALPASAPGQSDDTRICHYTGDPNSAYSDMTVSGAALEAHRRHERDIIPAPDAGCPLAVPTVEPTAVPTAAATATPEPAPYVSPAPEDGSLPAAGGEDDDDEEDAEPASTAGGGTPPPSASAEDLPMLTDTARGIQGIPYTGARPDLLGLFGLALLLLGAGARVLAGASGRR